LCDPIWQVTLRSSGIGFLWRAISLHDSTYDVADEGDFDASVDEGDVLASDSLLNAGHQTEVSAR